MAYLVSDLLNDLQGIGHGTSTDDIQNINQLIYRAARQLLADVDSPETIRVSSLTNLYDNVTLYSLPSDLKGNAIIDIRNQAFPQRGSSDRFDQNFIEELEARNTSGTFSIENRSGNKFLRLLKSLTAGITLNEFESLTGNGTWAASGSASSLAVDSVVYVGGSNALSFNVTGNSVGTLTNSTMTAVDLTNHKNISSLFMWVYMPVASHVTNVILRWGSSSSNYYTATVTTAHPGNAFQNGWNLLRFDWSAATTVGSPTITAMNYVLASVTHTASDTGYRVDSLVSILPVPWELVYYSKFLFNASGTWQETVTANTNIINLDTDAYNLLVNQCALLAAQQRSGKDSQADQLFFQKLYSDGVTKYNRTYPSQIIKYSSWY